MDNGGKLLLIDGNSYLYRAFFVMPAGMKAPDGTPTNAVFGFLRMLLKLLKDLNPTHVAVAFDAGRKTFRNEIYSEYKAHREGMPDELAAQISATRELLEALKIPILEAPGFEADDVIGTLARHAETHGIPVAILSGDRDFLQLASGLVTVIFSKKGVTEIDSWTGERVREELGIEPVQIIEKKGLEGDTSDNIPGVPGVGEKTALKLIKEFGTVDSLLRRLDSVKGESLRKKLQENAGLARMSRELSTIKTDVPLEFDIKDMELQPANPDHIRGILLKLGFRSVIAEMGLEQPDYDHAAQGSLFDEVSTQAPEPEPITDQAQLKAFVENFGAREKLYIHVAAGSENYLDDQPQGLAMTADGIKPVFAAIQGHERKGLEPEEIKDLIGPLLESEKVGIGGHDLKRDWLFLRGLGLQPGKMAFDTRIAAYLLEPEEKRQSIEELWSRYGSGSFPTPTPGAGERISTSARSCRAVMMAAEMEPALEEKMRDAGLDRVFHEIEMPLVAILGRMQYNGVSIDRPRLESLSAEFLAEEEGIEREISGIVGGDYNVRSPQQTADLLFDRIGLPRIKGDSTGYDVLSKLRPLNPVVDLILRHREVSKLRSTFVDGLIKSIHPRTGRLHTSFEQTATATGRLSSRDPNLQNIPIRTERGQRIRRAFTASSGLLMSADYSQIELRILAHFSGDAKLREAFLNSRDIHAETAAMMFSVKPDEVTSAMRRRAKAVNFGIIYGMTSFGLAEQLEISRGEADSYLKSYFNIYGGVRDYIDSTIAAARKEGFAGTLFGRRRALPELNSNNRTRRQFAERTAVNTPVQGTAADIMKLAMIAIDRLPSGPRLGIETVLQIHDELLFEAPENAVNEWAGEVIDAMEGVIKLDVPLKIDLQVGENWLDLETLT